MPVSELEDKMTMKKRLFRGTLITAASLLCLATGVGTMSALAAPPAPTPQFKAFKIGSYNAVALKDGTIEEPNDGKSFVVGQPTAEVAAALKSGGAPGDHFEF